MMEKTVRPHVLYISRWYPSSADPMLGLFVKKHALASIRAGFKVSVVYVAAAEKASEPLITTTMDGNLTEVVLLTGRSTRILNPFIQFNAWRKAIILAKEQQGVPQLIHAHVLTRAGLFAWLFGLWWHIPYIITEHWSRYYPENLQFKGVLHKWITRYVVERAAAVTVVSKRLADAMKARGIEFKPIVLPNVIDTTLFIPADKPHGQQRIVSVTCFEEKSKNLEMLINAFAEISPEFPDAALILIGEGADLQSTKDFAASKMLPPNAIRFTGLLQDKELAREVQQASCLALSSNYETFGIVAYEALACGVPVVATDVADLNRYITNETGIIVPVGNQQAFAQALARILRQPLQTDKQHMYEVIQAEYSSTAVSMVLKNLYNKVMNKTKWNH